MCASETCKTGLIGARTKDKARHIPWATMILGHPPSFLLFVENNCLSLSCAGCEGKKEGQVAGRQPSLDSSAGGGGNPGKARLASRPDPVSAGSSPFNETECKVCGGKKSANSFIHEKKERH